jgi:hypothetical protein
MNEQSNQTLEYFPERPRTNSSAIAWYMFVSPLFVAVLVGIVAPNWALPAAGLTAFLFWYRRRKALTHPLKVLTVRNGRLIVCDARGDELLNTPLDQLENVSLDTKTIQKVQENLSSGMPDLRFIDSRVGPAIDNSRIELVTSDQILTLTEHYTSSTDATEWFARIRRFLRSQSWQPLEERELSQRHSADGGSQLNPRLEGDLDV